MRVKKLGWLLLGIFWIWASPISMADGSPQPEFQKFSVLLKKRFADLKWNDLSPETIPWEYHRTSHQGRPLFFTSFGEPTGNTTIVLGGVHGNESASVYVAMKLALDLPRYPDLLKRNFIVVAPLVNPDGFFRQPQTRTNARGVDINRNFPTRDWKKGEKNAYYSGPGPGSENETRFQIALFHRFKPQKIVSIHSPLGRYDYDGPSSDLDDFVQWLKKSSEENHFPFRRHRVFPGSLGNYAGVERKIHTLTLELRSSCPQSGPASYQQFRDVLVRILDHPSAPLRQARK